MSPKVLVVGFSRCGKDEMAGFLHRHLGLPYCSSTSWVALPIMAEALKIPDQMAWTERHENRKLWKDTLDDARKDNPALLIQLALLRGGRVVTGVRDKCEIDAAKEAKLFQHIIWIFRPGIPEDPTVTFGPGDCTDFIRNDSDLRAFHRNITRWALSVGLDVTLSAYATESLNDPIP